MSAEILLFQRLNQFSAWMPEPRSWIWTTPGNQMQGPGIVHEKPGLANLLWLSLDMDKPPQQYDARANHLYCMLATQAHKMELGGLALIEQADGLTLAQFRNMCNSVHFAAPAPIPDIAPVLAHLASRRLVYAHA